jgi:hypothetical protein
MESWVQIVLVAVGSILASSGFWSYILRKDQSKDAITRLMMGMAYDYITSRGIGYIERGWIAMDELEELSNYYYEPYKSLGGNGVAERVMGEVKRLPIRAQSPYAAVLNRHSAENQGWNNNVRVIDRSGQEAATE